MKHMFSDLQRFRRDPLKHLVEVADGSTEALVRLRLGPRPIYLINDPSIVKGLLRMPEEEVDKGRLIRKLRSVIGDSIVVLSGSEHQRRRAVIHGLLGRGTIDGLVPAFCAEITRSAAEVVSEGTFDAHSLGSTIALRIMSVAAFGHHVLTAGDEHALVQAVQLIEEDLADEMFRVMPLLPWQALTRSRKRAHARQIMALIVSRVRDLSGDTSIMRAFTELNLSEQAIANEVLTLLLAGHHTTGAAIAWLIHAVASVPGLSEKLASEASRLTDDAGEIDPSRLGSAKVSFALVREVVRLYPSSWWFSRETKLPVEIAGKSLRRGTSLLLSPWVFHRSSRFWSEPDAFRLDRSYTSPAYIPFGVGPRTCVGMGLTLLELQLTALVLASAFDLRSITEPGRPKPMVMLMPPPITLAIEPRRRVRQHQEN